MKRRDALERLSELAEDGAGYVTRAQAIAHGIEDLELHRAAGGGDLVRVGHGVYRFRAVPPHDFEDLWVAWLRLEPAQPTWERLRNPQVLVSHTSAASVMGAGNVVADVHEFTSPQRRQTRMANVRLHRGDIDPAWQQLQDMAVTGPGRLVADLAADGVDGGHLGVVIEDLLRHGLIDEATLARSVAPYGPRFGLRTVDPFDVLAYLRSLASSELAGPAQR